MNKLAVVSVFAILVSCSPKPSAGNSAPDVVVLDFLKWYKENIGRLTDSLVLNPGGRDIDSTKFYAVNFSATEKYLNTLLSTGKISEKYIDQWRKYFLDADKNFKANPSNEGPPDNFDYDFILCGQDDPGLNELDKTKFEILETDKDKSIVLVTFPTSMKYKYYLGKYDGKWAIDDIEAVEN